MKIHFNCQDGKKPQPGNYVAYQAVLTWEKVVGKKSNLFHSKFCAHSSLHIKAI